MANKHSCSSATGYYNVDLVFLSKDCRRKVTRNIFLCLSCWLQMVVCTRLVHCAMVADFSSFFLHMVNACMMRSSH